MIDWDTYQTAYQAADAKTKETLHSSLIPECVAEQVKKHQLDDSHHKTLVRLMSEKVLGLRTQPEVIEAMKQAGIPTSSIIYTDLDQCLETKKPTVADTGLDEGEVREEAPEAEPRLVTPQSNTTASDKAPAKSPAAPASEPQSNDLASEIKAAEAEFDSIPKIKTMAKDAQEANTHSSSQDALLRKNN